METAMTASDTSPCGKPSYPMPASRSIRDVKVDVRGDGDGRQNVLLEWTDAVNERQSQQFYGWTAEQIATDLHANHLLGVNAYHAYLVGLIRGLYIERRVG